MLIIATIAFIFSILFRSSMVNMLCILAVVAGSMVYGLEGGNSPFRFGYVDLVANWQGDSILRGDLSPTNGMIILSLWSVITLAIAFYAFHRKDIYDD